MKERSAGVVVAIGVAEYDHGHAPLPRVHEDISEVTRLFTEAGFKRELTGLTGRETATDIGVALDFWARGQAPTDSVVFFWSGHGQVEDGHYLLTRDSPSSGFNTYNAVRSAELGALITKELRAKRVLVVLDTCYAGLGASDVFKRAFDILDYQTHFSPEGRKVCVIASSLPLEPARDGAFARALVSLLREGSPERLWSEQTEFITPEELFTAIEAELDRRGIQRPDMKAGRPLGPLIPNPRYRPSVPDEDVETKRRRWLRAGAVDEHLVHAARGIEVGETGWHFTGRTDLLRRIVSWLRDADRGMFVVTGSAGTGKSALLGRIVTLSVPELREMAEREGGLVGSQPDTLPPPHGIDVAIFARNKTVDDCVRAIASGFSIPMPPGGWDVMDLMIEEVGRIARIKLVTIVVDGLDEARRGQVTAIASVLLRPLAAQPGVRVLIGTRPDRAGGPMPAPGAEHWVLKALGQAERAALEDEPDAKDDLFKYALRRLTEPTDSPLREHPDRAAEIAAAIVECSTGIFLFARIAARLILRTPDPQTLDAPAVGALLQGGLDEVFERDLARYGTDRDWVLDLLRPLAWAEGTGIPRRDVWHSLATALSTTGRVYSEADVTWVLETAGFYIIESGEQGQAVYRLYHQALIDHLRYRSPKHSQQRITEALLGLLGTRTYEDWAHANPYLHHHLAAHAASADMLSELLSDPGWCVYTDPIRTFPLVLGIPNASRLAHARLYIRAAARLRDQVPEVRAFILHETATHDEPDVRPVFDDLPDLSARIVAVNSQPSNFHWQLRGHTGAVNAVTAFPDLEGAMLLASGGDDGTLRVWNPLAGEQIRTLSGHTGAVNAVTAFPDLEGAMLLASGGDDGTLRVWNPSTSSTPLNTSERQHGAVRALTTLKSPDGRVWLVAAGDAAAVWRWDPLLAGSSRLKIRPALVRQSLVPTKYHTNLQVRGVTPLRMPDGRVLLATPGTDGRVWIRDVFEGGPRPRRETTLQPPSNFLNKATLAAGLVVSTRRVAALTSFTVADGRVLLAGGGDRRIWVWEPAVGIEETVLEGHGGRVRSLAAFRAPDAQVLLASAGDDGTLRVWDLTPESDTPREQSSGRFRAWEPFTSQSLSLKSRSLARSRLFIRSNAVRTSNRGPYSRALLTPLLKSRSPVTVRSVRFTGPNGEMLLAVGGDDGIVRIRQTSSSHKLLSLSDALFAQSNAWAELKGHAGAVWAVVALTSPDGRVLLASGGEDAMVLVHDPFTQRELIRVPLSSRVLALDKDDQGFLLVSIEGAWAALDLKPELLTRTFQ